MIASARIALAISKGEQALGFAMEAVGISPDNPDAHQCAGDACTSLELHEAAAGHYRTALSLDPGSGDRHFDLAMAQVKSGMLSDALKNLSLAELKGCTPKKLVQIYGLLEAVSMETGKYDDALVNLSKAETVSGVSVDTMIRRAQIISLQGDTGGALRAAGRIKAYAPSDYTGYSVACRILVKEGMLDAAASELAAARGSMEATAPLLLDSAALEFEFYKRDRDVNRARKALLMLDQALSGCRPTVSEASECYAQAARANILLGNADDALSCLNAALYPAQAFNNGFRVSFEQAGARELTTGDIEEMIEADRALIAETFGEYGLEEMFAGVDPEADSLREYPPLGEEGAQADEAARTALAEDDGSEEPAGRRDRINRLFLEACELKQDYAAAAEYARKLQSSGDEREAFMARRAEARALALLGSPRAEQRYAEAISFLESVIRLDPANHHALRARAACLADTGRVREAIDLLGMLGEEAGEEDAGTLFGMPQTAPDAR